MTINIIIDHNMSINVSYFSYGLMDYLFSLVNDYYLQKPHRNDIYRPEKRTILFFE